MILDLLLAALWACVAWLLGRDGGTLEPGISAIR